MLFHVLNRGMGRMRLVLKDADFEAFERILDRTLETRPMRILAYMLMSNPGAWCSGRRMTASSAPSCKSWCEPMSSSRDALKWIRTAAAAAAANMIGQDEPHSWHNRPVHGGGA